ncbi:MAG: HAMP domain-containing histidine kinase [Candidatus Eisenbacteria bacterium]|uniref:histidine kinase n=1 Tax=Eiseniibacteriota bacterium TaxID=2212470 RepID=A0A538UAE1_UNCEI|nr:MAG: HAMP domain-containing histidine kinase [Candidatus Eisenbacteria bacterium]
MPRRGRSLFWVISGALLLTAVIGTFAQTLIVDAVLRPLEVRETRTRARLATSRLATEIAQSDAAPDSASLASRMQRTVQDVDLRFATMLYRDAHGWVVGEPARRTAAALEWLMRDVTRPPPAERPGAPPRTYTVFAREPAFWNGRGVGEIVVLRPTRAPMGPGSPFANAVLLSLPIAVVVSLMVGVVIVRLLVRRLRGLELLASRVAGGDLTVRVADASGDEIGRLAERLNTMTEHLAEARRSVEEHESQRQQLFADITHELATPLTSIRGGTETLLDPHVRMSSEERARYLEDILAASRRLDRLIRDLFDLARLEAGAPALEFEDLDWVALARNVAQRYQKRFESAGLGLAWEEAIPEAWIRADGLRMEQVLENLLRNALRYVPAPGRVALGIARVPGTPARYRLRVADDGPGLPAEDLTHLFERFYRGAGARAHATDEERDGSGLGLAIVREIVLRHGGETHARTGVPRGLVIEIELPAVRA